MEHDGDRQFEGNLDERVCPACRRGLRPWQDDCPDCRAPAVLRMSLPGVMPAVPAHLRDAIDQEPAEDARAVETTHDTSGSHELTGMDDDEAPPTTGRLNRPPSAARCSSADQAAVGATTAGADAPVSRARPSGVAGQAHP